MHFYITYSDHDDELMYVSRISDCDVFFTSKKQNAMAFSNRFAAEESFCTVVDIEFNKGAAMLPLKIRDTNGIVIHAYQEPAPMSTIDLLGRLSVLAAAILVAVVGLTLFGCTTVEPREQTTEEKQIVCKLSNKLNC